MKSFSFILFYKKNQIYVQSIIIMVSTHTLERNDIDKFNNRDEYIATLNRKEKQNSISIIF